MIPVVSTIETKCKRCYSCVRQCPAKAIKVESGQATVIAERCIACGNCIKVCPQKAKKIRDGLEHTSELLNSETPVIAVLAPSFPAAFDTTAPETIISGVRTLGFDQVLEVAFGADLIIDEYNRINESNVMPTVITSPCPAVVNFIEKYYPQLNMILAPIVSPMIAIGRAIKYKYEPDAAVVFIGPCIAKKREMQDPHVAGVIDEVLTFDELQTLFEQHQVDLRQLGPTDFDGPTADLGRVFPVSGGLIKCSNSEADIMNSGVLVSEGRDRILEVLQKVDTGEIDATFVDLLFCRGCINGPMMANEESVYVRRDRVINYVKTRNSPERQEKARRDRQAYNYINMRRGFSRIEIPTPHPSEADIQEILHLTNKYTLEDELNCGACGYPTCREKAIAVYQGLAEAEMCLPYMLEKLEKTQQKLTSSNQKLRQSLKSLRQTQEQLVQSEKLASVGRLAAGVAHELNNPLGGILLYTNILLKKLQASGDNDAILKVAQEAERCRNIVQGLLDFSRQTKMERHQTNLNQIIESTLKLVQQQSLFQNIEIKKSLDLQVPPVLADKLQMQQVFLNILLNAAEAMNGHGTISLKTDKTTESSQVFAVIEDNGPGMSKTTLEHIFDPFYTTKPVGKGTGLGLAIVYGILQKHGGDIKVDSREGTGTRFTIYLPMATAEPEPKEPKAKNMVTHAKSP